MSKLQTYVNNFISGDEAAFDDIYSATYRKVSLMALNYLKNHADAEDAVQDIYIQAHRKLSSIQDAAKAMSWLLTLTRNMCLNILDKRKRTVVTIEESDNDDRPDTFDTIEDDRTGVSPESSFLQKEHSTIVLELVANLPLEQKDVVMLHYIEQRSIADIAEITNTTPGTVKSRLNYARTKLKEMVLEKEKQGYKLRVRGLFILLPFILRRYFQTAPLSAEAAEATYIAIEQTIAAQSAATTSSSAALSASFAAGNATFASGSIAAVLGKKVIVAASIAIAVVIGAVIILLTGNADDFDGYIEDVMPPDNIGYVQATPEPTPEPTPVIVHYTEMPIEDLATLVLTDIARLIQGGLIEQYRLIYERLNESDANRLIEMMDSEVSPLKVDTEFGLIAMYRIEGDPLYASRGYAIYYGDFADDARIGRGYWFTDVDAFIGYWANDAPNGDFQQYMYIYDSDEFDCGYTYTVVDGVIHGIFTVVHNCLDAESCGTGDRVCSDVSCVSHDPSCVFVKRRLAYVIREYGKSTLSVLEDGREIVINYTGGSVRGILGYTIFG
jgi:RNA polymerase sigma-70 factor (ECF subfamily)